MSWLLMSQSASAVSPPIEDYPLAGPLTGIALITLVYLTIDVYLSTRTFRGIFDCPAFWLLYAVFCALGMVSFGALQVAAGAKMIAFVGHTQIAGLLHAILAVGGSLTVLQSFTLKLADFKVMDVGQFVDQFRNQVKSAATQRAAKIESANNLRVIDKLATAYREKPNELLGPLNTALSSAGVDPATISKQIEEIREHCKNNDGMDLSRGYAQRLVVIDADYARTVYARTLIR